MLAADLIQAACFDGMDLKAWSSRDPKDNTRGLRDPEARVGRALKASVWAIETYSYLTWRAYHWGMLRIQQR
ncbi:MAG: hypothetical protein B9J98_02730 [Candidatus Terraquivivens tikiterensis]|uniref:Uncharacterized protein n=1 Tax=Candidatus Terraquivivens tikiterensis TaxID=1980982 RepID=A0A2R7Y660_9ARCH|nr:MAG: hypothetical protein B9J98_02730 [Candidatus Terraquivivens tikiterensis]